MKRKMTRLFTLLLALVMIFTATACGGGRSESTVPTTVDQTTGATVPEVTEATTQAATDAMDALYAGEGFRVGFARVDITPTISVPLGGFAGSDKRYSTGVRRRLYADCVAIADDQDNLVLLYGIDILRCERLMPTRDLMASLLGIPGHHIIFNCSHTHSAPDTVHNGSENLDAWMAEFQGKLVDVATVAIQDLTPASMAYGSIETEGLAFIKHYQNTLGDGTVQYFGDGFGTSVIDDTTKHVTEMDPTLHIVEFQREGAKPVVMCNFRCHPHLEDGATVTEISSDYPGAYREAVELQSDYNFIFFQGAEGNSNCTSRIKSEQRTSDASEYGAILADYTFECLKNNMTAVEDGLIETRTTQFVGECNHLTDHLYVRAKEVHAIWNSALQNHDAVKAAGAPYGIRSVYHANSIISRYNRPQTYESELNAIAIADTVSLVSAPNEMYDTLSVMTEEGSPYPMTMSLNLANGYTGYIPSAYGWEYTSYESDVSWFVPGTGEKMVQCHLDMLNDMASN